MDAVKFIEERNRMCKSFDKYCYGCPAWDGSCKLGTGTYLKCEAAKQVEIVEEWSAAHPRKTRQSVFLEQYPNAKVVGDTGVPTVYPCYIEQGMDDVKYCNSLSCSECRREFWMQEVE